jgi:hypothetical protein
VRWVSAIASTHPIAALIEQGKNYSPRTSRDITGRFPKGLTGTLIGDGGYRDIARPDERNEEGFDLASLHG